MKSLILGGLMMTVSVTFAQADGALSHQLKKKFVAKQRMEVRSAAMDVHSNKKKHDLDTEVLSEGELTRGVVRVINGKPLISINTGNIERRMIPINSKKVMDMDGQEIQFRYVMADKHSFKQGNGAMLINVYEVSEVRSK